MTHARIIAPLIALTVFVGALFPFTAGAAQEPLTPNPSVESLSDGILPNCDPTATKIGEGQEGCGFDDGLQLIYNIIKYISYIVIPLAIVLLGYAGFTIMTSAGETEKITQAKHMMTMVIIGILFIFLSNLAVRYLFKALGVQSGFGPTNIKINETK